MPEPTAVCFDLDETLLDHSGAPAAVAVACAEVAGRLPGVTGAQLVAANTVTWAAYWPEVEDEWVVISGEHGIAKPDPAMFRIALDAIGADAAGTWHVGDSLAADVAGAQAAGLRAVWLNRRGAGRSALDPEPDLEIATLAHL